MQFVDKNRMRVYSLSPVLIVCSAELAGFKSRSEVMERIREREAEVFAYHSVGLYVKVI